jgi:hypothetical protein
MRRLLLACLALLSAAPALAAVPDPSHSSISCLVACPQGDFPVVVQVHDLANNPIANSTVALLFCVGGKPDAAQDVPTFGLCCDNLCAAPIVATTNGAGVAVFQIEGGGHNLNSGACMVFADGVLLGSRPIVSLDVNGNFNVDAADVAFVAGALGSSDPLADFNCNGVVDATDLSFVQNHAGHACHCPVPVRKGTWGNVKLLYR